MPHPGPVVRKQEFRGETELLDPDFVRCLRQLVPSLFEKASVKIDATGNELTATDVVDYFTVRFRSISNFRIFFFENF